MLGWEKIFTGLPIANDMSLKMEVCIAMALKVFHARTKECLHGFTSQNCGRGDKKASEVLRTKLKILSGNDAMSDHEKEKQMRKLYKMPHCERLRKKQRQKGRNNSPRVHTVTMQITRRRIFSKG